MATAREPVRFNEQDDNRTTINKLNRLVDELFTKLSAATITLTQGFKLTKNPAASYALISDADGNGTWQANVADPGGSTTELQYNSEGQFEGHEGLYIEVVDDTTADLYVNGEVHCINVVATGDGLNPSLVIDGEVDIEGDLTAALGLDGEAIEVLPDALRAALRVSANASNATLATRGIYTKVANDDAGIVVGSLAYAQNDDTTAVDTVNATGVIGTAGSEAGISIGLEGSVTGSSGPKGFAAHLVGHNWFERGNTYIRDATDITPITSLMTALWDEDEHGNLYVENHVEIGDKLRAGGLVNAGGLLTAEDGVSVNGDVTATGELDAVTLDISGNADVAGTLDVHGTLTASGEVDMATLDVSGNGDIDGTLAVGGLLSAEASVDVTGDIDATGELDITGDYKQFHQSLCFGSNADGITGDHWINLGAGVPGSTNTGYYMRKGGSVVGASLHMLVNSYNANAVLSIEVYKGTAGSKTLLCESTFWTVDATGWKGLAESWSRGAHTFTAGEIISVKVDMTTATSNIGYPTAVVDIILDE